MKKISVVTATRAEYGILKPLIRRLLAGDQWETQVIVTGTHLEAAFGNTVQEIEGDGIPIYRRIPILNTENDASGVDDAYAVTLAMAAALRGFGAYFSEEQPDLLVILGDRTEMLAIAAAAMNAQIPIAHLHGGELTQGAVDDCVRHALTKMSYLHFASAEVYRERIIQMGEDPSRVYNVGALGVENIMNEKLMTPQELAASVDFPADQPYAVVTFHPVTLEQGACSQQEAAVRQMHELLDAMRARSDLFFLITKANSDAGGRQINELLEGETADEPNMKLVASLGMKRYLSAVKHAQFVFGNSSSGMIEAPALGVPTVNIGDRQQGRIMAESVIGCEPERSAMIAAMDQALRLSERIRVDRQLRERLRVENPYGDGHTSEKIMAVLEQYMKLDRIDLKKKFYDLPDLQHQ